MPHRMRFPARSRQWLTASDSACPLTRNNSRKPKPDEAPAYDRGTDIHGAQEIPKPSQQQRVVDDLLFDGFEFHERIRHRALFSVDAVKVRLDERKPAAAKIGAGLVPALLMKKSIGVGGRSGHGSVVRSRY